MIEGHSAIRDAYRDETVARAYIDERFREPLGALLHHRQRRTLERVIRTQRPRRILEIAPGPARLTLDVARVAADGTVMDASAQMLSVARGRLESIAARGWRCVQGDAFQLPFNGPFDLVYAFRFIRHFEAADRDRLYRQMARVLRPGGLLVFDAINEVASAPLRARARPGEYQHYDALLRPAVVRAEVARAGFDLVSLEDVQRRYPLLYQLQVLVAPRSRRLARVAMEAVDRLGGGAPLEWVVTCRRR